MPLIRITGWKPGLLKVSLTQALRELAGLSLTEAKASADRVLNGEVVVFDIERCGEALVGRLKELGAIAEMQPGASALLNPSFKRTPDGVA